MPIKTLVNTKNQVVYTDTGHGSLVTLPMLALPEASNQTLMDNLFVGEEWVKYGYEVHRQFDNWRTQRRGNGSTNGNGGNGEESLKDDDIPL